MDVLVEFGERASGQSSSSGDERRPLLWIASTVEGTGYNDGVRWSVVEEFVETKIDGRVCEDLVVVTDSYALVIDGASDATGMDFGGRSGGQLAAETIQLAFKGMDPHATAREVVDELSAQLAKAVGDLSPSVRWPAATVVCLSLSRNEIWRVGDGSFVVDGEPNIGLLRVNEVKSDFRAAVNTALMASGIEQSEILMDDPGAALALALTNVQQHLSNRPGPWGYGVINGGAVPDEFLEIFELPISVGEVVLASDGYPDPLATLGESETRLHQLLRQDPAAIGELAAGGKPLREGANSVDDRAYLRLRRVAP